MKLVASLSLHRVNSLGDSLQFFGEVICVLLKACFLFGFSEMSSVVAMPASAATLVLTHMSSQNTTDMKVFKL